MRALSTSWQRIVRAKLRKLVDAQAAIKRMTHDEPGPGQTNALQARQAIAALRKQEPAVEIEIRWCPAHKGIPGNEAKSDVMSKSTNPCGHAVQWSESMAAAARYPVGDTCLRNLEFGAR